MSIFSTTTVAPKRYVHHLSFMNTMSLQNFGVLYPILATELVPGDVFKHKHALNLFYFPQFSNVMHGYHLQTYYFFVPYRVVWPEFDKFIQDTLASPSAYVKPYVQARDLYNQGGSRINEHPYWRHGSLSDYLGLCSFDDNATPTDPIWNTQDDTKLDTLWHRAYQKIWVDHFIDPQVNNHLQFADLINSTLIPHSGGENISEFPALFNLRSKCWQKDLFTTALVMTHSGGAPTISGTFDMDSFRATAALDKFRQIVARIGNRPKEWIKGIFGVTPPDYRLDMAEFITATSEQVIKGTVVNHNASTGAGADAQGFIASEFKTGGISGGFKYAAKEFGVLMGLACLVPDAVYFQGISRFFRKRDNSDHFNPYFEHIGDQMVENLEIFTKKAETTTIGAQNKQTFGYAPRYSEYKYFDNQVHGLFRDPAYLNYHDAKLYPDYPYRYSSAFAQIHGYIQPDGSISGAAVPDDYTDQKRIFNIQTNAPIAGLQVYHQFKALRPMDKDSAVYIKG